MEILRRLGTTPVARPGCTETGNCPDVFELDNGDYALIGQLVSDEDGMTTVVIPREVLLAAVLEV